MNEETLLEEIREAFDNDVIEWQDIRDQAKIDMQYVADGPWTDTERAERKAANRPCIACDELGQYTSQSIGDMRQNKRAIKVTPKGNGATDLSAQKRASMIREIEYKSNAQAAYSTAFENMVKRSYGYVKLCAQYCDDDGFDQELYLEAIPNPDTVYLDPYAKKIDWSDMEHGFLLDSFSQKAFEKRWPDAEIKDFDGDYATIAPLWVGGKRIQVAEYWKLEKKMRRLLLLDTGDPSGPAKKFLDELPKGSKVQDSAVLIKLNGQMHSVPLLNHRRTETKTVVQYITNGVEILETNPTKWKEIPIVAFFGPEEYVDVGNGSKRRLLSMVRKAREAYKSYCYISTNEVEVIGMVPKVIYMGYVGQFATNTPWADINKVAIPYGEVQARTTATGSELLPLPQRQPYDPPIAALEQAKASFRLAIQSAMGVGGMLNGKASQNADAKSGKAIEALDRQESQGTYSYISNFERGLERLGRLAEGALEWCYDTPREVGSREPDDTYSSLKINQPDQDEQGNQTQFDTDQGDHGVTISVGPSDDSTREAAADFVDALMSMPNLPPKAIALSIRLKNLGPIGDELADVFDPPAPQGPDPAQAAQEIQGLQQKLQTTEAFAQSLHEQIQNKDAELASRERIAAMQEETKRVLGLAAIDAKDAQIKLEEELGIVHKKVDQTHELIMQGREHAHAAATQGSEQDSARAQQGADQAHEAAQARQAQDAAKTQQESAQEAAAAQAKAAQDAEARQPKVA